MKVLEPVPANADDIQISILIQISGEGSEMALFPAVNLSDPKSPKPVVFQQLQSQMRPFVLPGDQIDVAVSISRQMSFANPASAKGGLRE